MMDKYFKVSICFFFFFVKSNFYLPLKKKERCDFITKHLNDFPTFYVVSLVLIM